MYETANDIPRKRRAELNGMMNQSLADAVDLQQQMKQAHWNVKGPNFIGLHKLFDEIEGAVEEYVDSIAERIVQLGGIAEGTARVAAKRSRLAEYPLEIAHGAPLRLRVERQLGYKHAKYVMRIELAESLARFGQGKGGFWEDRGYQWYAGI